MPYIVKRCLINEVAVPKDFHFQKKKPWENCLLDTQDIWKFGGYNTAKLGLIAELLGIPSPKDAMSGPEVNEYYWDGRLNEIKTYCEKDVKATAEIMLKISGMPLLNEAPF
jgi:predicted PolB exonuclease-like 3'-5' exonuclease